MISFADFLDNDRLKETFSSGALDFDEWTLLISEIETTSFPVSRTQCGAKLRF
jgi:pre-mRNA-processing factor 39